MAARKWFSTDYVDILFILLVRATGKLAHVCFTMARTSDIWHQGIPLNLREDFDVETLLYCRLTYELFDLLSKISSNQFLSFIV